MDYVFDDLAKTFACFQSPHHNFFQLLVTSLKEKARVRHAQAGEYALMTTPEAVIGLLKVRFMNFRRCINNCHRVTVMALLTTSLAPRAPLASSRRS